MFGQLPWAAPVEAEPVAGVVVDELPLSVLVELLPVLEDELELSLVCACATIAPPPIMAPASPTDNRPLRIHFRFCMCITSSRSVCVGVTQHVARSRDL